MSDLVQVDKKAKQQNLAYGKINTKNIELFKLFTTLTLPVTYSDNFYQKIIQYQEFSFLAFYNDILVGAITSREEMFEEEKTVYIMTFGVLPKYRRLGLGSQILNQLLAQVKKRPDIKCIYLHMWVANQDGYKFYLNKDFQKYKELPDYYQDITPPDCYILKKVL